MNQETKKKISETMKRKGLKPPVSHYWLGKKRVNSKEAIQKLIENAKTNPNYGMKNKSHSEKSRQKMSVSKLKNPVRYWLDKKETSVSIGYQRILDEIPELEKQGFRCIPIGKVIPDIIAIKDDKIFAVEVERGTPNYAKYTDVIKNYYDDIIWILRKRQ